MTKEKAKREFKKHWKYAMRLKEGGPAWEREMDLCEKFLEIGKREYRRELEERYCH